MSDATIDPQLTRANDDPYAGKRWGDEISEERQRELEKRLDAWDADADHGERKGPFDTRGMDDEEWEQLLLTGADVFYLVARALVGTIPGFSQEPIPDLVAARAVMRDPAIRFMLNVSALRLQGANLSGAQLNGANLFNAYLDHVDMSGAQLKDAILTGAHLERADFSRAHLASAFLGLAQLRSANFREAQLKGAYLVGAHLEGASLVEAHLEGANLRAAMLDKTSRLDGAALTGVTIDQIILDNTDLAVLSWADVTPLGDEKVACIDKLDDGRLKDRETRIYEFEAAVRANRILAVALRTQGLTEDADVFAYHAQFMQRRLRFHRRQYRRWLISWFFAALSGYGYRLGNVFIAYSLVLAVFALIYWALGVHSFGAEPWYRALWDSFLVSLSAIHGRAVFEQLGAWTPTAWVAAIESVVGIVIEGIFVAMLIQRLFR